MKSTLRDFTRDRDWAKGPVGFVVTDKSVEKVPFNMTKFEDEASKEAFGFMSRVIFFICFFLSCISKVCFVCCFY